MAASSFRSSFWAHVAPAVLYAALVFVGGSMPAPELPEGMDMPSDKLMHLVAFAGMQLVMFRAVRFSRPHSTVAGQNLLAGMASCSLGALLEFWQAALPHRSAELLDFVADSLGVLAGAALIAAVVRSPPAAIRAAGSEPEAKSR